MRVVVLRSHCLRPLHLAPPTDQAGGQKPTLWSSWSGRAGMSWTSPKGRREHKCDCRSPEMTYAQDILIFADGTGNQGNLNRTKAERISIALPCDPHRSRQFDRSEKANCVLHSRNRSHRRREEQLGRAEAIPPGANVGFSARVTRCYAVTISVWEPGDRNVWLQPGLYRTMRSPCP